MKRRNFLKTSLAAMTLPAQTAAAQTQLPWEREIPLRQAARSVTLESTLDPANPQPDFGGAPFPGPSMTINSLKMRTTLWGPAQRITISLNKNNVWDRRLHEFKVPTLAEITEGAFAPVNRDYVGVKGDSLRPVDLGWLSKDGGPVDPYRKPLRYAFPCMKPVGQIIIGMDALKGAAAPHATQSCANGVVKVSAMKDESRSDIEYVLGMTSDVYAIRGRFSGAPSPVWLRLYRHRDTAHMFYMNAAGTEYTLPEAEAHKAFNFAIDPPTSASDGKYFWIHQKFPAEKTFPEGFEYMLVGTLVTPGAVRLETAQDRMGLGTPPINPPMNREWHVPRPSIADAPGAAATASFAAGDGQVEALVTVVTSLDGKDLLGIARQKLAAAGGFDGVVKENTAWWNAFYDSRENGRVFHGIGSDCSDDIRAIYRSYSDSHGGGTKTDMRKLECSASYALPERDFQEWDSAPCYNEIFTTSRFVRNWGDSEDMWKQIVWHWLPGSERNAREMFGMPGMLISHGYLPPVKPDAYVHTTITLELCLGTMAQIVRPAWDEWDYGGDITMLRQECYPLMRRMALFYAAYVKKGEDGHYHIAPTMQEEDWGIYPRFSRNKDVISSLCMFRWALTRAADAADLLSVDRDLARQWRAVAAKLMPYPTWNRPEGKVFAEMPDQEPVRLPGDHFGDAACYPALLADEVNLDSPEARRDMVVRGAITLPSGSSLPTLLLMGVAPDASERGKRYADDAELMLNSRGGRMHLFPVTAPDAVLAFRNFQARGGFLVSACRDAGGVSHVEIMARRSRLCQVMNPWPGQVAVVREGGAQVSSHLDKSNGECLVFSAMAGRRYLIQKA